MLVHAGVRQGAWKGYQFGFISYKILAYIVKTMFIGEYCERLYRGEGCRNRILYY